MKEQTIRDTLRELYGPRRYRINRQGEIHVHSTMPNTNETGWWLFGYVDEPMTHCHLEIARGKLNRGEIDRAKA